MIAETSAIGKNSRANFAIQHAQARAKHSAYR